MKLRSRDRCSATISRFADLQGHAAMLDSSSIFYRRTAAANKSLVFGAARSGDNEDFNGPLDASNRKPSCSA